MKPTLRHHATIALLASSCALDFSWPLDLVTTCSTDDHCPEGLVCRFNSCGRDAVGKDGEPCNLDGRCEDGLLCDEIACRRSRNNEPVPVWNFSVGNGREFVSPGLHAVTGGAFRWSAYFTGSLRIGDAAVPVIDDDFGVRDIVAWHDADGRPLLNFATAPSFILRLMGRSGPAERSRRAAGTSRSASV